MNRLSTPDQPSRQAVRQAIEWSLRLQAHSSDASVHEQCARWRAQNPEHECAWQRIQALNSELSTQFKALPVSTAAFEALEQGTQRLSRRRALKLLSGTAVLGAGAWLARDLGPVQQWRADYATGFGQMGRFQLADGTQLQLNTDSVVDQDFNAGQALIRLVRGEMRVTTPLPPAGQRPLQVRSRHALFETLGGDFVVRQDEGRTRLSVSTGQVLIRLPGASPVEVRADQQYVVSATQATLVPQPEMDAEAWLERLIVTRDMRLRTFLTEVGRYRRGHLGCTDDIADLRLSGVFRLEDTDKLLAVLPQTLPVQVNYRTPWWVTLRGQV
ncbi:FecR family protein [Pseudomonas syringae]|nr:FecR family protein [Pseudomonas syringae]MBD8792082.1 FecR family protein [Pseudomonas syringae]MBD8803344.1 FecR family protein [Pseudomonas syringae]MBD8814547.1 FecR family protein [Pseudomonas syringae]